MALTKTQKEWLDELQAVLDKAPKRWAKTVSSYTIGDNDITIYDTKTFTVHQDTLDYRDCQEHCQIVDESGAQIYRLTLPFCVESTAG